MALILALVAVVAALAGWRYLEERRARLRRKEKNRRALAADVDLARGLRDRLAREIVQYFAVVPCRRCGESEFALIRISPNAKSVELTCKTCERRQWSSAVGPEASRATTTESERSEQRLRMQNSHQEALRDLLDKFPASLVVDQAGEVSCKGLGGDLLEAFSPPVVCAPETLSPSAPSREVIPAAVKQEVWRRDGGRCVDCGSKEKLEFDHIIPVARNGSNTARNLQLLCEPCNRTKGSSI